MPPWIWIDRSHAATAASDACDFAAAAATGACSSSSATHHAAQYTSERASSVSMYVSASGCETAWYVPIGLPNCSRVPACRSARSRARCATPTASAALLRDRDAEPAELRELAPAGGIPRRFPVAVEREVRVQPPPRLRLQLELFLRQRKVH